MKVLLSTLNSKFLHSSLALRYLKTYAEEKGKVVYIKEFTVNNQEDFIISEIYKEKPNILGFSCYIWNIEMTISIIKNLRKLLPNTIFIVGGPEVSYYQSEELLNLVDIVVRGEGEETFHKLLEYYMEGRHGLEDIEGISYLSHDVKKENESSTKNLSLNKVPFVYENGFEDLKDKIIYYETSRGCPFNCQYCLSSLEGNPRFLDIKRCFSELEFFLKNNVSQVKFIDRTFNSNKVHAIKIWKFLIKNDNGSTNFHFEIAADLLDEEMLEILKEARPSLFQFEIGIQSTNHKTLKEIDRKTNLDKLFDNIRKLKEFNNIHLHLDLIAGLPMEDFQSFEKSFTDVMLCHPNQLQLGFLKLLHGSRLRRNKEKYGIVEKFNPPYEIYYNDYITYDQVLMLKNIENIVEIYYNSGHFQYSLLFLETVFENSFKMYDAFANFWVKNGYNQMPHSMRKLYEILYDFCKEVLDCNNMTLMKNIIKFDIFANGYGGVAPKWATTEYSENEKKAIYYNLKNYPGNESNKLTRRLFVQEFDYDVLKVPTELTKEKIRILFDYSSEKKVKYMRIEK